MRITFADYGSLSVQENPDDEMVWSYIREEHGWSAPVHRPIMHLIKYGSPIVPWEWAWEWDGSDEQGFEWAEKAKEMSDRGEILSASEMDWSQYA